MINQIFTRLDNETRGVISRFIDLVRLFPKIWASLVSLILMYFFLWSSDQGQDILYEYMTQGFMRGKGSLMFLIALKFCIYNWYFPLVNLRSEIATIDNDDTNDQEEDQQDENREPEAQGITHTPLPEFLPRYFAACTILIFGFSLLHVLAVQGWLYNIGESSITLLLIVVMILLYINHDWLDKKLYNNDKIISWKTILGSISIVSPVIFHQLGFFRNGWYYISLFISPLAMAILVYAILLFHHNWSQDVIVYKKSNQSNSFINAIISFYSPNKGSFIHVVILMISLFFGVLIFLWNIEPSWSVSFDPPIILSVCILFWLGAINIIGFALKQISVGFRFFFGVLLFFLGFWSYTANQDIKYQVNRTNSYVDAEDRQTLKAYTKKWLDNFDEECPENKTIYLVSSYGGGIRAAYWTNLVLASYMDSIGNSFYDQVYSITGASGGMVGSGLFMAFDDYPDEKGTYKELVETYYRQQDFLSPMIVRLLGTDVIKAISPFPILQNITDRHQELSRQFSLRLAEINRAKLFNTSIQEIYHSKTSTGTPMIIMPTTAWSQKGAIGVYSPLRLDSLMNHTSVDLIDTIGQICFQDKNIVDTDGITMGDAVFESARFPIASPPGSLKKGMQFVDAGYVDNLGAGTTIDLLEILVAEIKERKKGGFYNINILLINSGSGDTKTKGNNNPLFNPITSFINLYGGKQGELKNRIYQTIHDIGRKDSIPINLISDPFELNRTYTYKERNITNIYPLGWYLSKNALDSMSYQASRIKHSKYDISFEDLLEQVADSENIDGICFKRLGNECSNIWEPVRCTTIKPSSVELDNTSLEYAMKAMVEPDFSRDDIIKLKKVRSKVAQFKINLQIPPL